MAFPDAVGHLLNFFFPVLAMALLLPTLARLVWWHTLRAAGWWRLVGGCAAVNAAVWLAGLLLMGRDGAMLSYVALVLGSALTVWWMALR